MESTILIQKIIASSKIQDILDVAILDSEYKRISKIIHPDNCKHAQATEASAKLNGLRDRFTDGDQFTDDAGTFRTNGHFIEFSGKRDLLELSLRNYQTLMALANADHFKKYLPENMGFVGDKLRIEMSKRAVPLIGLELPQKHVNWVLSRMLEFSVMLHEHGYSHCGINPECIFVVPETHIIIVTSFYYMVPMGGSVKSISGKYINWYPAALFREKVSTPIIDVELSKRISVYLLGDSSGMGVKLKKTHHEKFLDFVIHQHPDSHTAFTEYRKMLDANFEKKFHVLENI